IVGHFDGSNMLQFFWKTFANLFGKKDWQPDAYLEKVKAMYDEVLSKLEMETNEPTKNQESILHMTFLNNLQAVIPLMHGIGEMEFSPEMILDLLGSLNVNRQFFINSGRTINSYATEVGIPYMTRNTQPTFFSFVGKSSVEKDETSTSVSFDMTFRVDRFSQSSSSALIPWMGKTYVSGIENRQLLVLPFKFKIDYDKSESSLSVKIMPNDPYTKEHFGIYSQPFTVRAPIMNAKRLCALEDFKLIRNGPEVFKDDLILPETDFNLGAVFVGDVQPLFSRGSSNNFYANIFRNTGYQPFPPTNRYYAYKIGADYSKSKANEVQLNAQYVQGLDQATFGRREFIKDYVALPGADNYEVSGFTFRVSIVESGEGFTMIRHEFAHDLTWANGWTPRYESKIHWQFQSMEDELKSRCIYVHTSSPRILSTSNTRDFLDINHATKVTAQTYVGGWTCDDDSSGPVMQFDGEMTLTDAKKERLGYELPNDCKKTLRNPNNFEILSYDKFSYTRTWKKGGLAKFPFLFYLSKYFVPGIMFPKAYYWYGENESPADTETFEAYKQGDGWNFKFERPNMNSVGEQIEIPQFIEEFLLSPRPYEVTMYDKYFLGYDRPICYATDSQVQTFDGLTFDHSLGNCWTVAVRDCKQNSGLVNVRNNGGFEASILWTVGGLKVDITKDQVKINNEVVEPDTVTDLYQVHQVTQGLLIQISWVAAVRVTSVGISIEVHPSYKSSLCGACSNYDGEAATMTGPMGCSYSDYDMFMAAWAMPGHGCDDVALAAKKEKVKAYQESCSKQFIYPTGQVLTSMKESCFNYTHDNRMENEFDCWSLEPVQRCNLDGCTSAIVYNASVAYGCTSLPTENRSGMFYMKHISIPVC
ncbi:unnamed protein product, partial [Meganyctiphanes norvegica]